MIVKDEQDVIARCLRSVRPFISSWCIVDTGSTDKTEEIILNMMKGIPGSLHKRPKDAFAKMRNEAWELALGHDPGYLMFIDADEELAIPYKRLPILEHDAYLIWVHHDGSLGERYWMVKHDYPNRWSGRIHEDIEPHGTIARIPDTMIVSHIDGARAKNPADRNASDLKELQIAIQEEPENARYHYYLGATYHLMGFWAEARKAFQKRLEMEPKNDETYRRSEQFLKLYIGA